MSRSNQNAGLAWPEVLFVLALLLMLASVVIPALLEIRNTRKSAKAYSHMKILISASKRFNQEYRVWPSHDAPERKDVRYGEIKSNSAVLNILGAVEGTGNEHHTANPARIDFIQQAMEQNPISLNHNERGEAVDPWGSPYQIVYDSNYDNICTLEDSSYGSVIGEGVAVWSKGPDRKSDTDDDLLSWRL